MSWAVFSTIKFFHTSLDFQLMYVPSHMTFIDIWCDQEDDMYLTVKVWGTWGVEGSGANEDTFPSPVISALDAELTYLKKGGRPAYPAVQPQNLPWQPNPRLAQMLSAPVADLESQVHMLQQQIARFEQSPAPSAAREPTTAGSATPSPVPANVGLPSLPINVDSPPPPSRDDVSSSKAPDGSTKLVRPDTKSSLLQAFEKGKAPESTITKVHEPEESTDPASSSGVPAKAEYGTASHVASVVNFPDDSKKSFMTRQWKTCRNDREVTNWIESVTLSKSHKKKLVTWSAHVQKWHDDLPASEQAALDQTVANWGVPIRDVAKLKAGSLLRILAVATVLIA
ncbi:hypothetical protein AK812_SmicGene33179 [Symbiodinium microadriaticum]|uniref:Uncharacterized protein n=1 Tax=Symbiodinium microadriaticum TaxID=2951 RepID=A0A1Q9CS88_SYMMI|nr:hypothetical protein AK812_SmicGene33179 [Symbiodinium microadriaticum]